MTSSYRPVPLKDWERADKLNVELVGYGWQEKRIVVRLHLPKDRDQERLHLAITLMVRDVKHSKDWACTFCGAPSRETHISMFSWPDNEPPGLIIYLRYVCDMTQPHVREGLREVHETMNTVMGGMGPYEHSVPGTQPSEIYPLAGSCICCEREDTAASEETMKRCSQCKLTRYCSVDCQKKDWPRHKVTCGMIYSVTFENWE